MPKRLYLLALAVVAIGGFAAAALAVGQDSEVVACATATSPGHTVAVDGVSVYTIPEAVAKKCETSTAPTTTTVPTTTNPTPRPGWSFCAWENTTCVFTGTLEVSYGANSSFTAPRTFTGGVACNNATFGDPIQGVRKWCETRPVQVTTTTAPTTTVADPAPGPINGQGYQLTFSDDFTTLDVGPQNKWSDNLWYQGPANPGQRMINNGVLELRAGAAGPGVSISTLWDTGVGGTSFLYGYFEMRARWTNHVSGAWPALWLLSTKNRYGQNAASPPTSLASEFDIFEGYNIYPQTPVTGALHRNTSGLNGVPDSVQSVFANPATDYDTAWHTYAGLWTAGTISWYFDNGLLKSVTPWDSTPQQMMLIIDMWLTGSTGGQNAELDVDWVHVWQR